MSQSFPNRWPKCWSFSISLSSEHSGLISFRMDWLDLLAVQGTLKSLLQHHSSRASILWDSAFFTVQLSHPHMTTGKTITLTTQTFVDIVVCWRPAPVTRKSAWRDEWCQRVMMQVRDLTVFNFPSPRFIVSINHYCPSSRVSASGVLSLLCLLELVITL